MKRRSDLLERRAMILNAVAEKLKRQSKDDFKGRQFEAWLIIQAMSWYLRFPLSYRDLEEMFRERGFEVDHSSINRWVLAYAPTIDLVLDLTLLPTRRRGARNRLDQMMRAHLQKAAIIPARLANEDRLHRRLRIVVDAAPADATIELERLVVGVEYQFLGLPKVTRTNGMQLCDSFMCVALTVTGRPRSVIVSWLQSNW